MTAPAVAAGYFLDAVLVGLALGLCYGFLRPLRRRATVAGDGLFLLAALAGWVYLAFGICAGDIRLGYTLGMLLGAMAWEATVGRLLRPVFRLLWNGIFWPGKKIFEICRKFYKFLLAILKKWFTIAWTIMKAGGAAHGKKKSGQAGVQAHQSRDKSRHFGRRRPVAGGAGGAV